MTQARAGDKALDTWLALTCLAILGMVAVGGITRLTNSGLSIVEWRPITGTLPPLSARAWDEMFALYRETPQYRVTYPDMTLDEFKRIFFWEYVHRLYGRLIGLLYLAPGLYFLWKGRIPKADAWKFWVGAALGGAQGAMGWFMVKSGLSAEPLVSHYRLAAHLLLAIAVLTFLYLWRCSLRRKAMATWPVLASGGQWWLHGFLSVLALQILYGAFTAGTRAGYVFNTWPDMQGAFLPADAFRGAGVLRDLVANPVMIQFCHRMLGYVVLVYAWGLSLSALRLPASVRNRARALLGPLALAQVVLGIATLVLRTPVSLGTLHQVFACVLWLVAVHATWLEWEARRRA